MFRTTAAHSFAGSIAKAPTTVEFIAGAIYEAIVRRILRTIDLVQPRA
jgi:hypothetical protein